MSDSPFDEWVGMALGLVVIAAVIAGGIYFAAVVIVVAIPLAVLVGVCVLIYIGWQYYQRSHVVTMRREEEATRALYAEVQELEKALVTADEELITPEKFGRAIMPHLFEALAEHNVTIPAMYHEQVRTICEELFATLDLAPMPDFEFSELRDQEAHIQARQQLRRLRDVYRESDEAMGGLVCTLIDRFGNFFKDLPRITSDVGSSLSVMVCDALPDPRDQVRAFLMIGDLEANRHYKTFDKLRTFCRRAIERQSGLAYGSDNDASKYITPDEADGTPLEIAQGYLQGSPFLELFKGSVPFDLPEETRFEHTHIVAGTGHGKTQLLQLLIKEDLEKAVEDGRSVVVIDGQGSMIDNILHMPLFARGEPLADRVILVDPRDMAHPACLNMFDINQERLKTFSAADQETIFNGTIDMYTYLFGALLGADLTQKQDVIFRYLARLMLSIPNATVHTLREVLEDGERFLPQMQKLEGTAHTFFETQFFHKDFKETKQQISRRLWGVLSNTTLERMFNNERNKIDMFDAINSGKIILINTAKDVLKTDASQILGRFFIAMLGQATIQRTVILPESNRVPTFVYVDEASEYIDDRIEELLNQARKYRVGILSAHQHLDQLTPEQRGSYNASTAIKFAGGVSAKDARSMSAEMRCTPEMIMSVDKIDKVGTQYACYVRNTTKQALTVWVPFGQMEKLGRISSADYDALITANRERYCGSWSDDSPPGQSAQSSTLPDEPPPGPGTPEGFVLGEHESV